MIFALLFVYVANLEYEECPRSTLVIEALTRPLEEYAVEIGDSPENAEYLDNLRASRLRLFESYDLEILNRDEADLESTVELPAWGLTQNDLMQFVRPDGPAEEALMFDPLTIVNHLIFLHQLNRKVITSSRPVTFQMLVWERNRRFTEIRGVKNWFYQMVIRNPPWPRPRGLILRSREVEETTVVIGPDKYTVTEEVVHAGTPGDEVLQMLDMGTGILNLERR